MLEQIPKYLDVTRSALYSHITSLAQFELGKRFRIPTCSIESGSIKYSEVLPDDSQIDDFAHEIALLLGIQVRRYSYQTGGRDQNLAIELMSEFKETDMIILSVQDYRRLKEWNLLTKLPISHMVVKNPYWPVKNLLLVLQDEEADDYAIEWSFLVAKRSGATITVLPILSPVPLMYAGMNPMSHNLSLLMASNSPLGCKMRKIVQRFADLRIAGSICFRYEAPNWQIQSEAAAGNYDLIVIACESGSRFRKVIEGDIVCSVLDWAELPILIAKFSPDFRYTSGLPA
jgi:hypothetical protein